MSEINLTDLQKTALLGLLDRGECASRIIGSSGMTMRALHARNMVARRVSSDRQRYVYKITAEGMAWLVANVPECRP